MHAQDLDGDGTKELIFVSRQNQNISMANSGRADLPSNVQHGFDFAVEVLDQQLRPLARHVIAKELKGHVGTTVLVADLDHDGRKEIVLAGPNVQVLEFAPAKPPRFSRRKQGP